MQEYQPSKLLQTIVKSADVEIEAPPKKFKVNPNYVPPEHIELEKQNSDINNKDQKLTLDDFLSSVQEVKAEKKKEEKKPKQQQEPVQAEMQEEEQDSLQMIHIQQIKEFSHMRPVIIGEQEEQVKANGSSFLQALREGNVILQLPNKLPFHDLGKPQKQGEEFSKDPIQQQLREFYKDSYDSSGFPLSKPFTTLSNQKNVGISLGKIVINGDGKVSWKAGREEFDIVPGIAQNLDQKCLVINNEDNKCGFLEVGEKFLVKPNY